VKYLLLAFAAFFALGTCQPKRMPDARARLAKLSASSEVRLFSLRGNPWVKTVRLGKYPEFLACLRGADFVGVRTIKPNSNQLLAEYGLTSPDGSLAINSYPSFAPLDLEITREATHEIDLYRSSAPSLRAALDKVMVAEFGQEWLSGEKR